MTGGVGAGLHLFVFHIFYGTSMHLDCCIEGNIVVRKFVKCKKNGLAHITQKSGLALQNFLDYCTYNHFVVPL